MQLFMEINLIPTKKYMLNVLSHLRLHGLKSLTKEKDLSQTKYQTARRTTDWKFQMAVVSC